MGVIKHLFAVVLLVTVVVTIGAGLSQVFGTEAAAAYTFLLLIGFIITLVAGAEL